MYDDGNHQDDQANDGSYALPYIHTYQEGTYTFTFTATGRSRDGKDIKREAVRSKYVEGRIPIVVDPTGGGGKGADKKCCKTVSIWLRIGVFLLVIIAILLFLLLRR